MFNFVPLQLGPLYSLGGDKDTLSAITGNIAEAVYGVPDWIREKALSYPDVSVNRYIISRQHT
jgi:ADP-ribosylglycohydrolase